MATTVAVRKRGRRNVPRGTGAHLERNRRTEMLMEQVYAIRRRNPTTKYATILAELRKTPGISKHIAENAIREADEVMREEFQRFCQSAPRALYDAYMDIHAECMRERNYAVAKSCLDSVRDMFGLRAAIQVNVTNNALPADAYGPLNDEELAVLAKLDLPDGSRILDARSIDATLELAGVASDVLSGEEVES